MKQQHPYSHHTRDALTLFGLQIRERRIAHRMTMAELAERVGVSRGLIQRLEKGEPGTSIGVAFEAARIVGIPLFEPERAGVAEQVKRSAHILSLMPRSVRRLPAKIDDDF